MCRISVPNLVELGTLTYERSDTRSSRLARLIGHLLEIRDTEVFSEP